MAGINIANLNEDDRSLKSFSTNTVPCVFISHQQKDKYICKKIAQYLIGADINVYFDEFDDDLKKYNREKNSQGIVECLINGISNSDHMLVVVSPETKLSWWVPWEIGYGHGKINLAVLTIKGIEDRDLPDYLKTVDVLRGLRSLDEYLKNINNGLVPLMDSIHYTHFPYNIHPLKEYFDTNK